MGLSDHMARSSTYSRLGILRVSLRRFGVLLVSQANPRAIPQAQVRVACSTPVGRLWGKVYPYIGALFPGYRLSAKREACAKSHEAVARFEIEPHLRYADAHFTQRIRGTALVDEEKRDSGISNGYRVTSSGSIGFLEVGDKLVIGLISRRSSVRHRR